MQAIVSGSPDAAQKLADFHGETVRLEPRPFGRGIDAQTVRHLPVTDRRLLV
ncbi:hypothetical protein [Tabrizicola sp. BL-A-41-H6]|uniref:hypothetical protein n=1 Tax=Tabrizicola sp. BL-A-41-H6 TaxID=3421107 RepID=UPI003D66A00C